MKFLTEIEIDRAKVMSALLNTDYYILKIATGAGIFELTLSGSDIKQLKDQIEKIKADE